MIKDFQVYKKPVGKRKCVAFFLTGLFIIPNKNPLYKSVMNIIVRANKKEFQEVKDMCEALEELMHDELEERRRLGIQQGIQQGENRVNDLNMRLSKLGKTDDILKAAADKEYQRKLFQEFGL